MNSHSGKLPSTQAGNSWEHNLDLPDRGGIIRIRRGDFSASTSLVNCSSRLDMSRWTHPTLYLGSCRRTNPIRFRRASILDACSWSMGLTTEPTGTSSESAAATALALHGPQTAAESHLASIAVVGAPHFLHSLVTVLGASRHLMQVPPAASSAIGAVHTLHRRCLGLTLFNLTALAINHQSL